MATRGRATGLPIGSLRGSQCVGTRDFQDSTDTALVEHRGYAPCWERVWEQSTQPICNSVKKGLSQPGKAESIKLRVQVVSSELAGKIKVL